MYSKERYVRRFKHKDIHFSFVYNSDDYKNPAVKQGITKIGYDPVTVCL